MKMPGSTTGYPGAGGAQVASVQWQPPQPQGGPVAAGGRRPMQQLTPAGGYPGGYPQPHGQYPPQGSQVGQNAGYYDETQIGYSSQSGYNIQQQAIGAGYRQTDMSAGMPQGGQMTQDSALQQQQAEASQRTQKGIRSAWGVWPATKQLASQCEVPVGLVFMPFHEEQEVQIVGYEPVRARSGNCILCPQCSVDFRNKHWTDPFSQQRNPFPPHYGQQMTEQNLCAELVSNCVDYKLGASPSQPPTYLLVVDTALYEEELDALKDSLQQVIGLMPTDSIIGLITFGTVVHIHELGFAECVKTHVLRGNEAISKDVLKQHLKLGAKPRMHNLAMQGGPIAGQVTNVARKFLCPLSECEFILNVVLDDLIPDAWPVAADHRSARATGAALSAAVSLMELCCHQQPGRIILFTGGICTVGPGQIVGTPLSESIRQHLDIQKDTTNAKYTKKAIQYYSELAKRAVVTGHAIDLFCCSLDQTGLYEMKVLAERTGGIVVMSDTFSLNVFRDSLRALFEAGPSGTVDMAFNVRIEALCSKDIKVCGAIGCCTSTEKKGPQVAELSVGQANTCEWVAGAMSKNSTVAFYLEICNTAEKALIGRSAFIQLQVMYTRGDGERRCRVLTVQYPFGTSSGANSPPAQLGAAFDQEAATVLMARLAVCKTETDEPLDILRWLDRKLIRLVALFADYRKDQPETFQLGAEFLMYPAFMYHLRRSYFLQTFNSSPDETAYYRTVLLAENLQNTVTMISPTLFEYSLTSPDQAPTPVLLDSRALKPDVVLLLDSFFHLVVWHGEQIVKWKEAGYHQQEKFANLKAVLDRPLNDAKQILQSRLPCPKFVVCNAGGSQARFLLAKVNPSNTKTLSEQDPYAAAGTEGTAIITDDVSMKVFMDHLIKLAVSS